MPDFVILVDNNNFLYRVMDALITVGRLTDSLTE